MDLTERMMNKETDALKELMDQYGDYLLRTAYLLLKDYQLAEEVVQDTFITANEKISQLKSPDNLKGWLTTITINRCRSHMRKWSFKHIFPARGMRHHDIEDTAGETPEDAILQSLNNDNLSEAIQELDYKYREAIILFYFNQMKIKEIAQLAKAKETTIKSRLKRGRTLLKGKLTKEETCSESKRDIQETTES